MFGVFLNAAYSLIDAMPAACVASMLALEQMWSAMNPACHGVFEVG